MEISPGELIAVLGPNGSGKTTLLRVLLGLLRPVSGSVEIQGAPPRPASRNVGYIPQHHDFDAGLPIRGRELVELGLTGHRYGIPWPRRDITEAVDHAISEVGAQGYADAPVGLLSGGEQQRLRIAQALLGDPSVLLCDEPLLALDPRRQQEITELIDRHRTTHNAAVLFVTHDLDEAIYLGDRVIALRTNPTPQLPSVAAMIDVPIAHPRDHLGVKEHPEFLRLRRELYHYLGHG